MRQDNEPAMTINRGLIFWGLALVTGGVVALAAQLGYIDRNALAGAWRLWPLVLIAIGLSIILARTGLALVGTIAAARVVGFAGGALIAVGPGNVACGGSEPAQLSERHGSFSSDLSDAGIVAAVKLEFDCGTLDVTMAKSRSWTVASGNGAAQPQVAADANSLSVSSRSDRWWGKDRQHWEISLPIRKSYELLVEPNAADTSLDLAGGGFQRLNVHPNAGSLRLDLRGARVEQLDLALNAGSVSIIVGQPACQCRLNRAVYRRICGPGSHRQGEHHVLHQPGLIRIKPRGR
jgi:hypothetical protein